MTQLTELGALIASRLRDVPDFPQPGVLFKDIAPLLADKDAFAQAVSGLAAIAPDVDLVAGVEARGFMLAGAVARELGCGMVPVRKAGKLPPPTVSRAYDLEYGTATIEVPTGLLDGESVLLVDDVLATGGTMLAAAQLVEEAGGRVVALGVLLELSVLPGRATLDAFDAPLTSLLTV